MDKRVTTLSITQFTNNLDLYKIVDLLKRSIKEDDLMFGLPLGEDNDEAFIFTICWN
ncbi:DUF4264 family protein [Oceanobacillus bengalensis]|uniref:DUF4264 domain-containing protein n=1 Tax=Oceanobacillus bengalensis TaxID=1435466 RepID=A0A494YV28_9BACI|nr:DUF4264 family protein [Oceanobacillus bengalensis]RKQ13962.1 DUF4264 domain-containing protein [Oceanobacillus bengalensis]